MVRLIFCSKAVLLILYTINVIISLNYNYIITIIIKRQRYRIRVRATDRGTPELYADVDVELDVVDRNNRPPIWETPAVGAPISPIYVKENSPQGHVVTTVRARFVQKFSRQTIYYLLTTTTLPSTYCFELTNNNQFKVGKMKNLLKKYFFVSTK